MALGHTAATWHRVFTVNTCFIFGIPSWFSGCGKATALPVDKKNRKLLGEPAALVESRYFLETLNHCHHSRPGHAGYTDMPHTRAKAPHGAHNGVFKACPCIHWFWFLCGYVASKNAMKLAQRVLKCKPFPGSVRQGMRYSRTPSWEYAHFRTDSYQREKSRAKPYIYVRIGARYPTLHKLEQLFITGEMLLSHSD